MLREIADVPPRAGCGADPLPPDPAQRRGRRRAVADHRVLRQQRGKNTHLIERRELTHVWLNHGDSEKPACYNPVHAIYDLIFAAGQAGIDRYARHGVTIPGEKFRIVGRPQVEVITSPSDPSSRRSHRPCSTRRPGRARTPTAGSPRCRSGARSCEALLDRGDAWSSARTRSTTATTSAWLIEEIGACWLPTGTQTGRAHRCGAAAEQAMTVEECFNAADAMISDVSAVVSDYLRSDKPYAIVSVGRTPEQLRRERPRAGGVRTAGGPQQPRRGMRRPAGARPAGRRSAPDQALLPRRLP